MKVGELIELLKDMPPEIEVILQKDAEGSGYSPLAGADSNAIYKSKETWWGEVYSTDWAFDEAGYDSDAEWQAVKAETPRCCVLYPIN